MTQLTAPRQSTATAQDNPLLAAALNYAKRGLPVFPCRRADKSPLAPHGFKDATTDHQQIRQWWSKWPSAMIGMPTGMASGIVVIDIKAGRRHRRARIPAELGNAVASNRGDTFRWAPSVFSVKRQGALHH
jgi:Bifunctional DNA primase/polymerase, N-terminal